MIRFRLEVHPDAAGGFVVRTTCPRGEGRSQMAPLEPNIALSLLRDNPRLLGEKLFAALFQGATRDLYLRSLVQLEDEAEATLRLELIFDPKDSQVAAIQSLPWELLREPDAPEFIALDRRRSIARYLIVPRSVPAAKPPKKLRILAVAADPRLTGARPLNLEEELQNFRKVADESANLELIELQNVTLASLRHALVEHRPHVLHFLGHGGRHEMTGEQVLYFMGERRAADPVSGADLTNALAGFPSLRLVVLNACESGVVPEGSDETPFNPLAGIASSLVLGRLPAVIAMRKPVLDSAAIAFARSFYPRLVAGDSIDAATVEGRNEVHSTNRGSGEWATPILFLRSATGELFPTRDLPPEGPRAKRLGLRLIAAFVALLSVLCYAGQHFWVERRVKSFVDQGAAEITKNHWTEAREHFAAARELAPRSAEIAANLAATDEQLGDVRAAEDLYREAARLEPESADRLYDLGHFLNDHGNPTEAYAALSAAVKLPSEPPRNGEVYAELARAAMFRKLFPRARAAITTALKLDPERAEYHRRHGEIEILAGSPREAIPPLQRALEHFQVGDLGRIETLALLAKAEDQLGEGGAACRFIAELRPLDPAGISPWAPEVDAIAARRHCSSPTSHAERNAS